MRIIEIVNILVEKYGAISLKADFEAEGSSDQEVKELKEYCDNAGIFVTVKIGGCEAVRDLKKCRELGVSHIMAPMIETAYAALKFKEAFNRVFFYDDKLPTKSYNIETITSVSCLDEIISVAKTADINLVIGRVDLSQSLCYERKDINSVAMDAICEKILAKAMLAGLKVGIGGGVNKNASKSIFEHWDKIDSFETRKVVFGKTKINKENFAEAVNLALLFERELLLEKKLKDGLDIIERERLEMLAELMYVKEKHDNN